MTLLKKYGLNLFYVLGSIGLLDVMIQGMSRGEVRPIRIVLTAIFGAPQ